VQSPDSENTVERGPPPEPASSRGWCLAALVFLATLLIVNYPIVLGDQTGKWDVNTYFYPFHALIADSARQGHLLMWTPLLGGGAPMGVEPQIGAASPFTVGLALLTGGRDFGFRVYWLVIWSLAGLGVLLLARHLGTSPWIGCAAAIGYAFSAIFICHAEHTSYITTMAFAPWVLWRLDAALVDRSLWAAVQAGALWGLSGLGGYPGLILGGAGYALVWCLGRILFADKTCPTPPSQIPPWTTLARKLGFVAVVLSAYFVTGVAILSPTYLGFLTECRGYSERTGAVKRTVATGALGAMPPGGSSTFSSPYLTHWNMDTVPALWDADPSLSSIYISPILLVLALTIRVPNGSGRFLWLLRLLALFYVILALGGATPLYGWLYDHLPPLQFIRYPALFRCYYVLTIVVLALLVAGNTKRLLAGSSADAFWKSGMRVSLTLTALAFVAFAAVVGLTYEGPRPNSDLPLAIGYLVGAWLAVCALMAWGSSCRSPLQRKIICRCFLALAIADAGFTMALGRWTVSGPVESYRAGAEERSLDLTAHGLARTFTSDPIVMPLNETLLWRTPTFDQYCPMFNPFHLRYLKRPVLLSSALGSERTWFSPTAIEVPLTLDCFAAFTETASDLGRPCLVVSNRDEAFRKDPKKGDPKELARVTGELSHAASMEPLSVTVVEYSPDRLVLDAVAPSDGWALVTDRWAQGWRATVNGDPAELPIGNFIFRAVRVQQGANRIEFDYRPVGYPWLVLLSWTTLGSVVLVSVGRNAIQRQ
jgi:hypothetical protein